MAELHRRNIFRVLKGTNTRAELVALQGLLWSVRRRLTYIMIVGNSKAITDWLEG